MNTKELESCLHIIGYWLNEDETVIEKILNNETQIVKRFVEPFGKELNANLLSKDTIEAKRDLIKFYVFEFWELQEFYKQYEKILFIGSLCNYAPVFYEHTNENGTVRKLNEFENYVVNSWNLFNMLFNEIQLCCIKYNIDFFKICNELNFSLEYFDSGISIAFEEIQKENLPPQQTEPETPETPKTFEELFYNPEHAEPCLKILSELQPPVIDAINNYIGKAKGVFPLWVKILKNHKPEPLIKHFKDAVYKDLLNQKVKGLNLSKDASEFRKQYKRVEKDKIELDIKTILSQFSQSGKLGK